MKTLLAILSVLALFSSCINQASTTTNNGTTNENTCQIEVTEYDRPGDGFDDYLEYKKYSGFHPLIADVLVIETSIVGAINLNIHTIIQAGKEIRTKEEIGLELGKASAYNFRA